MATERMHTTDNAELSHRCLHHGPPNKDIAELHETVRQEFLRSMAFLNAMLLDCREKSVMFTKLEEAMFWANASVARNHKRFAEIAAARAAGEGDDIEGTPPDPDEPEPRPS